MAARVTAFDAKTRFRKLLDRVSLGEEVIVTRHDKPVARIVPADRPARAEVCAAVEGLRELRQTIAMRRGIQPALTDDDIKPRMEVRTPVSAAFVLNVFGFRNISGPVPLNEHGVSRQRNFIRDRQVALLRLLAHALKCLRLRGAPISAPQRRGNSSVGRARPCQGRGREFESRFPLHAFRPKPAPVDLALANP